MLINMETTNSNQQFFENQFLIAMPSLADDNFSHSVTYICEHTVDGAMGITINRPTDILLQEILAQSHIKPLNDQIGKQTIYQGGPVQTDRGFILHRKTEVPWDATLDISDEMQLTSSKDILEAIAQDKGPKDSLIALGYAGWGSGQLEKEIADNIWLNCPADINIIFHTAIEKRWETAASLLGINLQLLSNDAGHA